MSEHFRRVDEQGNMHETDENGTVWVTVPHGHSPIGRSQASKKGWETRRAKAAAAKEEGHVQKDGRPGWVGPFKVGGTIIGPYPPSTRRDQDTH